MAGIKAHMNATPEGVTARLRRRRRPLVIALALATIAAFPTAVAASCSADEKLPPPSGAVVTGGGGPCSDGASQSCHITIGQENGVLTCYQGTQVCAGGAWSACADGSYSKRPAPLVHGGNDPGLPSPGPQALSGSTPCVNNPCDPSCQTFDEDPDGGIKPDATFVGSFQGGEITSIPPGFVGKGIFEPCDGPEDCQFDHQCKLPGGDCVPWPSGGVDPACASADLTAGVPCTGHVPICNRGSTVAPAGVVVYVYPGNSSHFPKCFPDLSDRDGECVVPAPINPGACVNITDANCTKDKGNGQLLAGNRTVMVNPPVGAASGELKPECRCNNNWTDYHSGGCQSQSVFGYAPSNYKQIYKSQCPQGTRVQWGYLAFDTTTPGDASVIFEVRTADPSTNGVFTALKKAATAKKAPLPDTQDCLMAGPAPCPVNLTSLLGVAEAQYETLELIVTLNPTSDKTAGPTLNNWEITYSCPPSE